MSRRISLLKRKITLYKDKLAVETGTGVINQLQIELEDAEADLAQALVEEGGDSTPQAAVNTPTPQPNVIPSPKPEEKIKVLFFASNPKGMTRLDLDEEMREITNKVRLSDNRDGMEIISAWAARPDDLLQFLNEHRPHIVHFSGHGSDEGELFMLDQQGAPKKISTKILKTLFRTLKDNIRVVVLNACYSEIQAKAIAQEIDFVIGMNSAVGDKAAIAFSSSFYRALCFGKTIQQSFDQANLALMMESEAEEHNPQLVVKEGVSPDQKIG